MNFKYIHQKLFLWYVIYISIILAFLITIPGCKKFVQIDPPTTEIAASTVFSNNASAAAAMTGIYIEMMSTGSGDLSSGIGSISYCQGLAADELTDYNTSVTSLEQFYQNALTSSSGGSSNNYYWYEIYKDIYAANSVIAGLQNNSAISDSIKQQLTGEALFMRAFFHFYAVNLYGAVPIVTTTNYQTNNTLSRSPVDSVYRQVIHDLEAAQAALPTNFVDQTGVVTTQRTRPNNGAATALLARAFLYTNQWDSAALEATALINNSGQYGLVTNLQNAFLANSTEAIWQLEPVVPGYNTYDGLYFILTSAPGTSQYPAALSPFLLSAFEPGDLRYTKWVDSLIVGSTTYYYPYKYEIGTINTNNPVTEYVMVLRLAEQYLIRAEAQAEQGNIAGAQADLNTIRARAGLAPTTANDQTSLLAAISHERQVELFTEWGHRWFDLIRTANINRVLGSPGNICTQKGGSWNPDWILLPLPLEETQINQNLTQNPGYE